MATVIAKIDNDTYLMEVSHTEIEKFQNLYYGEKGKLSVGGILDFGRGYDFANEIKSAFTATQEYIEKNKKVIESINNGISVLKRIPKPKKEKKVK